MDDINIAYLNELSNSELRQQLRNNGIDCGPVVDSTRQVYIKRLWNCLATSDLRISTLGSNDVDAEGEENDDYFGEESTRLIEPDERFDNAVSGLSRFQSREENSMCLKFGLFIFFGLCLAVLLYLIGGINFLPQNHGDEITYLPLW